MSFAAQILQVSRTSSMAFCVLLLVSLFVTVLSEDASGQANSRPMHRERSAAQIQAGGRLRKVVDQHYARHGSSSRGAAQGVILPGDVSGAAADTGAAADVQVWPDKENLLTAVSPASPAGGPNLELGDTYGEADAQEAVVETGQELDTPPQGSLPSGASSALNISIRRMGELPGLIDAAQRHSDQALAAAQEWKARAGDALPEMVKLEDFTKQMEEKMVTGNEVVKSQVASGRGLKERHLVDLTDTVHAHVLSHSVYTRPRDRLPQAEPEVVPAELAEPAESEVTPEVLAEPEAVAQEEVQPETAVEREEGSQPTELEPKPDVMELANLRNEDDDSEIPGPVMK